MNVSTPLSLAVDRKADRLDAFLAAAHPAISRSRWKQLIVDGRVLLNGCPAPKPNVPLSAGDVLSCSLPDPEPVALLPVDIPLAILHEDSDVVVLDKPPGLVVHPAPGHPADTLVNALLHHCADLAGIGGELRPGIVHRLDKDTSGVLVVAKNELALARLVAQFSAHSVEKEYLALVWGNPKNSSGTVDLPIGRHPVHRQKMSVSAKGRPALSRYRAIASGPLASLLEVRIETGRTHQIRVHLAHLGHPVVGDPTYGRARRGLPGGLSVPRQMLHARRLRFAHPRDGRILDFFAPIPQDFLAALRALVGEPPPSFPNQSP